jgi:hypothetical protein
MEDILYILVMVGFVVLAVLRSGAARVTSVTYDLAVHARSKADWNVSR